VLDQTNRLARRRKKSLLQQGQEQLVGNQKRLVGVLAYWLARLSA
jgi:hypothetical protein